MGHIHAWTAEDALARPDHWQLELSAGQRAALRGSPEQCAPVFHAIASACARSVFRGWGLVLVRGFVSSDESSDLAELRLRALGRVLGREVPQSPDKQLVGYLEDRPGSDWREEQPLHTDGGDTLALLCLRPAAVGGATRVSSALAAYHRISRDHPALLELLRGEWQFDRKGRPGPPTLFKRIFEWVDGELHCFHLPGNIRRTLAVHGLPPFTEEQTAALDLLDAVLNAPEFRLEFRLESGDLLVLDNRVVVHARSAYDDLPDTPRRLLLRMWWAVDRRGWRGVDA